MGLTVDFDLDVMLTAHDEWCKYPTVPAVAVYDLARQEHLPGVDAMPFLWCGGEWTELSLAEHGLSVRDLAEVTTGGPIEENWALRERVAAEAAAERAQAAMLLTVHGIDQSDVDKWLADPSLPRAGSGCLVDLTMRWPPCGRACRATESRSASRS